MQAHPLRTCLEQFTEKRNDWNAVFLREKGQKAYTKKG